MQFPLINTFEGGLNQDTALVSLPSNQYDEAQDCEFISDEKGNLTTIEPKRGTGLAKVTVPNATVQSKLFRVKTYADTTRIGGTDYYTGQNFILKDLLGNTILTVTITNADPFVNNFVFATDLQTAFGGSSIAIVDTSVSNDDFYTTIQLVSATLDNVVTITQEVAIYSALTYTNELLLLRDLIKTETALEPLAYVNSQNLGFVLSVSADDTITELGVADEDNNWAYTRLLRTKNFVLSKTQPIKLVVEQQNDGVYALYFTDFTIKDKCIYVPPSLTQDCCLTYTPISYQLASKGIYNLQQTDAQTNSQLINNIGYVTYKNTLQSGGGLLTGGKRYVCRFGINGSNITTQWSILSNLVPVIQASADSGLAWVSTQGTPSGTPTSKQNIVTINNAQADIFNFVELAVINYTAENASSAELIGRFDVLGENFDITHSGLEQTVALDLTSFIEAEPVLLRVRDLETKKNRMNRANTVTANEDPKWLTIAESATVTTERFEVTPNTGVLPQTVGNKRFSGYLFATADNPTANALYATKLGTKQVLPLISTPITPPVTPSPYVESTGSYTVTASDAPLLQFNLSVDGIVRGLAGATFFNMYFIVMRGTDELGSVLLGSRNIDVNDPSDYKIYIIKTFNLNVVNGDVITFKFQLSSNAPSFAANSDFTKTYFETTNEGIRLNLNQAATSSSLQFAGTQVGEYQIPYNVANRTGYMLYEYYMIYVRFHLKNGYITAPYPLGQYNIGDATYKRGLTQILPLEELNPFTDTSGNTAIRKVYNYALNVSIDITSVQSELLGISFERSDPLNTVIGSGIYHNARKIDGDTYTSGYGNLSGNLNTISPLRNFGLFISNDLDDQTIKFSNGDYLKLIGIPRVLGYNDNYKSGNDKSGVITELLGSAWSDANDAILNSGIYELEDSTSVGFNAVGDIIYNTTADLYYKPSTSTLNNSYTNAKGIATTTTYRVGVYNNSTTHDSNTFIAFYIRPIDLNSVDYKNYKPIPTGEILRIYENTNPLINQTVYGGDTYTQKVIRKAADWYIEPTNSQIVSTVITFYAQNRLNSQLFYTDTAAPIQTWNLQGSKSLYQYLFPFAASSELVDEQHNFDKSYIGENQINRISPYNPKLPYPTSNPTRIYYTDEKAVGSLYDAYRKVKALNFVDLELQNGAITAIFDIRDVVVVIQPNFVGAIPYAADTMIQSDNTAKILVGSGTVYSNRVYPLSSYGTSIKTLTCKGYNTNGNPQAYWLSDDFTNFNRYDYSGVKILSADNNMRTFFLNNVAHIKNEFDANIYYNTKKEDIVITARATKVYDEWNSATTYNALDTVVYGTSGRWKNFEETKAVYVSTTTNTNSNPYDNPSDWTFKAFTDTDYYNMWSLIFNEKFNNFRTFFTPLQKRYFRHNNYTLSPRGVGSVNKIYLMDNINGDYMQWFPETQGTDYKQGEFILSTTFNKQDNNKQMKNVNFERGDGEAVQPTTVTAITPTQTIDFPINETRTPYTFYPAYYDDNGDNPFGQYVKILIKKASYIKIRTIGAMFKNKFPLRIK
jgi:hypothetical protein